MAHKAESLCNLSRTKVHGCGQASVRSLNQLHGLLVDLANEVRLVKIRVMPAVKHGDVQVHDVSILKGPLVRNAMANDLIDGPGTIKTIKPTSTTKPPTNNMGEESPPYVSMTIPGNTYTHTDFGNPW